MKFEKVFISRLLLFTYVLVFSHSLVPHCEVGCMENQTASHGQVLQQPTEQHEHDSHGNFDHNLIAHNGHSHEGLYGLIICFLSQLEHHSKECSLENYVLTITKKKLSTQSGKTNVLAALFVVLCTTSFTENSQAYRKYVSSTHPAPWIGRPHDRGPPASSC